MRNFGELVEDTAVMAQRSGDADYKDKTKVWLNLSHEFLFNVYDYYLELQDIHNFDTVADQEDYPMPSRFDKPLRIFDLTNDRKIDIETEETYFDANIANIADAVTDKPNVARMFGVVGVTTPISTSGDTVQVKSSSTSDAGNFIVRVEGFINSDLTVLDYEDITISAASPTTFVAGTKTFYKITHVAKSDNTVGFITLADSSEITLELLSGTQRVSRHRVMKLGKIPDDTYSIRILFKRGIPKLVDDNDYPFIDADNFMILNSAGYAYTQDREGNRANNIWAKAKEALQEVMRNQNSKLGPDFQHKLNTMFVQSHRS